jgi:urea transport system permease protein
MPDTTTPPPVKPLGAGEATSQDLYQASQTFLLRAPDPRVMILRYITVGLVLLLFFVAIPVLTAAGAVPDYKLNFLGKYLCFAIVALGIDLVWGYTGLLSLCQALFFALGGYAMAMHLSLKQGGGDVRPEYNDIPQFMFFNNLHALPAFWKPFSSFPIAVIAGFLVPGAFAGLFGFLILRNRIRGVYFAIITQALAQAAWLLMCRNEMLLGGTNGLTNYSKGWQSPHWIMGLYMITLTILALAYLFCRALVKSRLGRVLIAIRDKETRLYFAGYKPHAFKVFAFAVGAMLAGLGGMLYPAQVGIITPQDMNVTASIFMVVGVALGGRGKLWGAVFGALLLNVLASSLSTDFASAWLGVIGIVAVSIVLFLPEGFAGIWDRMERQVATGATFWRWGLTGLPLLAVTLFVLGEVLGLTPGFLQGARSFTFGVPPKYLLLVAILAAAAIIEAVDKRNAGRRARGFVVRAANTTPPAVAGGTA